MLEIFEIAKEEGIKEGTLEAMREMVVEALIERFNVVSAHISEQIRTLQNQDVLKGLFHQAIKCQSLQEFETVLKQVI